MSELPEDWISVTLSDVAQWGSGGTPSRANPNYYGGNIPWVKTGELGQGLIKNTEEKITDLGLQNSSAKVFPKGSVLIAMYGATIGKTAILDIDAATNQACAVGMPREGITTTGYLFHYLSSQKDAFIETGKGAAQPNISQRIIKDWIIPLAPFNEQKRISDKLDSLIARVNACRDRLDRVPRVLKQFRQSILNAATSGELTKDWRTNCDLNAWQSAMLNKICLSITDGDHQAPPQVEHGIPFITISAINDRQLRLNKATRFVPYSYFEQLQDSRKPEFGDILFSVTGSIAIPALVNTNASFTFQRHIAILKPDLSHVLSKYLFYSLCTEDIKSQAVAVATGTAQKTIPLSKLRVFVIPLPPKDEQHEIVRRVDILFAYADRLEIRYKKACAIVGQLTTALLDKAFRGDLVPQDPNDEPASLLLERIRLITTVTKPRQRKSTSDKLSQSDVVMLKRKDIQPSHLSDILKASGSMTAENLWSASQLEIDDFYDQLKDEEASGFLKEKREESSNAPRLLEAV